MSMRKWGSLSHASPRAIEPEALPSPMSRTTEAVSKTVLLCALALTSVGHLMALDWKTTELFFTTQPFQSTQEVVFEFQNTSDRAVTLVDVQTNCDCLEVTTAQKIFSPGARGKIKALFKVGERAGVTERMVTVTTDEGGQPVRLRVRVEVPEIASFEPRTVNWRLDEATNEKTIEIRPAANVELQLRSAQATNSAFTARLETVETGKFYRVHLKPTGTSQPASAAIRISGKESGGREVVLSAYANVQ